MVNKMNIKITDSCINEKFCYRSVV